MAQCSSARGNRPPKLKIGTQNEISELNRGFGDIAPMSPFGFPNNRSRVGLLPSQRFELRPAPQQPRRPHTTRNARFARPEPDRRPHYMRPPHTTRAKGRFTRPFDPNYNLPHSAGSNRNCGYPIPNANPSRTMSPSTRLSYLAEKDRHSFSSSSTRSYKSMSQTDSSQIRDVFLQICARLESKHGKENLIYPREIIWMIGPPGAGKSTLATFFSEQRSYESKPIHLREIFNAVIAANDGKLKIEQVVERFMINLFDPQYAQGVVIDGFVSITCSRVVPSMFKYFHEIHELSSTSSEKNPSPPVFKFCVLYVNEDNSIRRQLVNHRKEEPDEKFKAEDGRKLYQKFQARTQQVVELIEMHFSFHPVIANGTLAQVQMIASAEIASETNGALTHNGTLVKAFFPVAKSKQSRTNRSNSCRNPYRAKNSSRSHNNDKTDLTPKLSHIAFHSNLPVGICQHITSTDDRDLLNELRTSVIELTSNEDASRSQKNRLPSAKLMSIDTSNVVELISTDEYVVRPNILGTHCMMYWDAAGTCYLVDCHFNFFTFNSDFYQPAHIGESLLDGVMAVDTKKRLVFIAHDAATHRSKRLKDCWFSQRSHECRKAVEYLSSSTSGDEPVAIVYLDCLPLTDVKGIMEKIEDPGEGEPRLLTLGDRQIAVYGLTFVPNKPGFHARDGARIYTCDFREDATCDFKVEASFEAE